MQEEIAALQCTLANNVHVKGVSKSQGKQHGRSGCVFGEHLSRLGPVFLQLRLIKQTAAGGASNQSSNTGINQKHLLLHPQKMRSE